MAKYDKGKMQASETEAKKYGLTLPYIPDSNKPSWESARKTFGLTRKRPRLILPT